MNIKTLRWILIIFSTSFLIKIFILYGYHTGHHQPSIFVSVASYRDTECQHTLEEIFKKSQHPERIYVGVTEQNKTAEEGCVTAALGPWAKQVRVKHFDYKEAKGPTLARYWCSTLYKGQTYFMQIDSHTKFEQDWDTEFIRMHTTLEKTYKKPIITHYPESFEQITLRQQVPVICKAKFNHQDIPVFEATIKPAGKFYASPVVAGGLIFGRGEIVKSVPFDPNLPFIFEGEEILYSARLYTHGYEFFSPDKNIIYHHYIRKNAPKFWTDNPDYGKEQMGAQIKVKYLLGISQERPPQALMDNFHYGLGTVRNLADFTHYSGIDFVAHQATTKALFCP